MRLVWRQHGYNLSTKIDQRSHVMNRTLFSLFGLVPIIFLLLIMLAACGGSSPSTSGTGVLAIDNAYTHGSVIFRLVLKNQHRAGHTALATSPRVLRGAVAPPRAA